MRAGLGPLTFGPVQLRTYAYVITYVCYTVGAGYVYVYRYVPRPVHSGVIMIVYVHVV